jgi:branched-chain amino acid transport system substrate-binding protein
VSNFLRSARVFPARRTKPVGAKKMSMRKYVASGLGASLVVMLASLTTATAASASSAPVKIAFLNTETGENAPPNVNDSVQLAVQQLNAKGGINGHKVVLTTVDSGTMPAQAITAAEKAIAGNPTVVIGLPYSSSVLAAEKTIKQSGIPTLQLANDNTTDYTSSTGATDLFRANTTNNQNTNVVAKYILAQHPKTVGLWDDSNVAGVAYIAELRGELQKGGVKNFVQRSVPLGATDTTAAALAMKGTDIIAGTGFPVTSALFAKQLKQNGVNVPYVFGSEGQYVIGGNLDTASVLSNDVYLDSCDPSALSTSQAQAYVSAYNSAFPNGGLLSSSPNNYDAVNLVAAAIKKEGGSLQPSAIIKGLGSVSVTGVCGSLSADKYHNLFHEAEIISTTSGKALVVDKGLPSH